MNEVIVVWKLTVVLTDFGVETPFFAGGFVDEDDVEKDLDFLAEVGMVFCFLGANIAVGGEQISKMTRKMRAN